MKIIGWILTILGGMLCLGALIQLANGELVIDRFALISIGLCILVLTIGLMIIKKIKDYEKENWLVLYYFRNIEPF